jgi:hypothetical protein
MYENDLDAATRRLCIVVSGPVAKSALQVTISLALACMSELFGKLAAVLPSGTQSVV